LFSSRKDFDAANVNSAFEKINSRLWFEAVDLEGNLRSTAEISEFVREFQE
jgi:hypothetical protein